MSKNSIIDKYQGFIFDLDGTIYLEEKIINKADVVINQIKQLNKKIAFVSNKTTGTAEEYFKFLKTNSINVELGEIVTSTEVIKKYLQNDHHGKCFFAIAEDKFIDEIKNAGLQFDNDPSIIDLIIVTLDRTLNYSKLEVAARALDNGAMFLAANIDNTCPVENGEILDAGSTISALEKRTGRTLQQYFGKPSKLILEEALKIINTDLKNCLIVGDRLETDIAMGNNFGIDTALVYTGVTKKINENTNYKPTYNLKSIYDLIQ